MRIVDKIDVLNRRRFLGGSVGAAALAAVLPAAGQAAVPLKTAPASALPTLVRMARDLYPHDRLPDSAYEAAVAAIDEQQAEGAATLGQGAAELDAEARKLQGKAYLDIEEEAGRVAVLTSLEAAGSAFFKTMRGGMITALYNQQDLWAKFGYEGSSAEKGGYLHRGFDDLDWLPA